VRIDAAESRESGQARLRQRRKRDDPAAGEMGRDCVEQVEGGPRATERAAGVQGWQEKVQARTLRVSRRRPPRREPMELGDTVRGRRRGWRGAGARRATEPTEEGHGASLAIPVDGPEAILPPCPDPCGVFRRAFRGAAARTRRR
jgi:hypothetical protein